MSRRLLTLSLVSALVSTIAVCACSRSHPVRDAGPAQPDQAARAERERARREAAIARDFPWHGLIRAKQLRINAGPDRTTPIIGWARRGTRVRVKPEPARGPGCTEGWYALHPRGYACRGTDMLVGETPPEPNFHLPPAPVQGPLPYDYFYVSRAFIPQFIRQPTDPEWAAAMAYGNRLRFFTETEPTKLARFLEGKLRDEPTKPDVVLDYLMRGYYVSSPHEASRGGERFVRSVQGRFITAAHLEPRRGSVFEGFSLEGRTLPIVLANRPSPLLRAIDRGRDGVLFRDDETQAVTRHQDLASVWRGKTRLGDFVVHRIGEDRYLKEWFVSVIESIQPEFQVGEDETWIHVDLGEQTLVLYRGRTPVWATLVSTGMAGHETPTGRFRIERKFVGSTMDNVGPEAGAGAYRIEDVPWTQYFNEDLAIHGEFWHDRFGIPRSHGCVNLSPRDAFFLFSRTTPTLPEAWHGIPTSQSGEAGTVVWITR
jgi:hypothetical protein